MPTTSTGSAASVPDAGGVVVVPALAGLGAPYWAPDARAASDGLPAVDPPAHLVRAAWRGSPRQVALLARAGAATSARRSARCGSTAV